MMFPSHPPSSCKPSPRRLNYKSSCPPIPTRTNNLQNGEVVRLRESVKEVEEWTHDSLATIYEQQQTKNVSSAEQYNSQINVLDQSMKKMCDILRLHCADESVLLWKLWTSLSDIYSEIFKSLSRNIEDVRLQLVDKQVELQRWMDKCSALKAELHADKVSREYSSENPLMMRKLEEELVAKDNEMLRYQDLITSLALWFPNFEKFGGSVLSKYLPPISPEENDCFLRNQADSKENILEKPKMIAQTYLMRDLKRLEGLGLGLRVLAGTELMINSAELKSTDLDFCMDNSGICIPFSSSECDCGPHIEQAHRKCCVVQHRKMMIHLQELEKKLLLKQSEWDVKFFDLEAELNASRRRESLLRSQLTSTRDQTNSFVHCLPPKVFIPCFENEHTVCISEHSAPLDMNTTLTQFLEFLHDFSTRSKYSSNEWSDWSFDNMCNFLNGQAIHLRKLRPIRFLIKRQNKMISNRILSLIFEYFIRKYRNSDLAIEKISAFIVSIMLESVHSTEDLNIRFLSCLCYVQDACVENGGQEDIFDVEKICLLVGWFRAFQCHLEGASFHLISIGDAIQCFEDMFKPFATIPDQSLIGQITRHGGVFFKPFWSYLSSSRQNAIKENINSVALFHGSSISQVSVFQIFLLVHGEMRQYMEKTVEILQHLYDFLRVLIPGGPSDPVFSFILRHCLSINPLDSKKQAREDLEHMQLMHELHVLDAGDHLNARSFALAIFSCLDLEELRGLLEIVDNSSISTPSEAGDPRILKLQQTGISWGALLEKHFYSDFEADNEVKFECDVQSVLTRHSKPSMFLEGFKLVDELAQLDSSSHFCLHRLNILWKLHFDSEMLKGLSPNYCFKWFILCSCMALASNAGEVDLMFDDPAMKQKVRLASKHFQKKTKKRVFFIFSSLLSKNKKSLI